MEFFLSASNGILGLPIQACILSHWHASMPTFPSKCRKESEKPTGSSRDKIDGKERGPLQSWARAKKAFCAKLVGFVKRLRKCFSSNLLITSVLLVWPLAKSFQNVSNRFKMLTAQLRDSTGTRRILRERTRGGSCVTRTTGILRPASNGSSERWLRLPIGSNRCVSTCRRRRRFVPPNRARCPPSAPGPSTAPCAIEGWCCRTLHRRG